MKSSLPRICPAQQTRGWFFLFLGHLLRGATVIARLNLSKVKMVAHLIGTKCLDRACP